MPSKGEFPLRENCDPTNPEEAFLWMFAALPGLRGAPLIMPIEYYRLVSKHLWELGARPTEEPTLEYVAPTAADPHVFTSPGRWVPAGTGPTREEQAYRQGFARMGNQQKAQLFRCLRLDAQGKTMPKCAAADVVKNSTAEQKAEMLRLLTEEHENDPA